MRWAPGGRGTPQVTIENRRLRSAGRMRATAATCFTISRFARATALPRHIWNMAIVVIGGHSRSVGKTSVVAGLIAALPAYHWSAFKITQYGHGICSRNGKACDCATGDHSWAISEEQTRSGDSDTSRFMAAGATRAWWVRTEQGRLAEAMPAIRRKLGESANAIVESNSLLKFLR